LPLDFPKFALGWEKPLGFISLIMWDKSSLKCIREDIDLSESIEGEEGAVVDFPLSNAWWDSIFSLLLAWEDCTSEFLGASWTMGFKGGGAGKVKLGQPRCWETAGWTISSHP
jgi:hypothetical protein